MKICTKCEIEKPLSEFSKMSTAPNGLHYWCKLCMKEYKRGYYAKNNERLKSRMREYYKENREKHSDYYHAYHPKYRTENGAKVRANNAKRHARKQRAIPAWADLEKLKKSTKIVQKAITSIM